MRRSITGPVAVIGIGLLFLLNNFYPDSFSWRGLFQYWPFLLIGLGAIQLLEVVLNAGRGRPLPGSSSFSTGAIVLLVLACFLFWAISRHVPRTWHGGPIIRTGSIEMFGEEYNFDVKRNLAVAPTDVRVVIEGVRGNVTVTGGDSTDMSVDGHKSVRAFNDRNAKDADEHSTVELVRNGNELLIRATGPADRSEYRVAYDLDIKVPKRLALAARGSTDSVTVESLDGNVDIAGDSGSIRLTSIGGNSRIETTRRKDVVRAVGIRGDLDLRGTGTDLQIEDVTGQVTIQGSYFGTLDFRNLAKPLHFESDQTDLRVEKLPGSITMDLSEFRASNITGPLRLRCQSRDVHIDDFASDLEINVDRGDVELRPQRTPLGKMDVHLRAGNVDLTLPEKGTFDLRGNTAQGDVSNDYGNGISTTSEGRAASLKSTTSGGGAVITVTTDRGNITVKKS